MKRIIVTLIFTVSLTIASVALGADGLKLGFVDIQKIFLNSDAGKQATEQYAAKGRNYEKEIKSRGEELKRMKDDLERQTVLLSESARSAKEKEYQQKLKEFQRYQKDAQEDLQAKEEELTNKIGEEFYKVVQDYGRKNGYTFIFVKDNRMIYTDDKADLTEELLKSFNASRIKSPAR